MVIGVAPPTSRAHAVVRSPDAHSTGSTKARETHLVPSVAVFAVGAIPIGVAWRIEGGHLRGVATATTNADVDVTAVVGTIPIHDAWFLSDYGSDDKKRDDDGADRFHGWKRGTRGSNRLFYGWCRDVPQRS